MRFRVWLMMFFLVFALGGRAQSVQVNMDPVVEKLLNNWTSQNRSNPRLEGWRIQILSSTDRQQVEAGKTQFQSLYPDILATWVHEKPYYKLRVGVFRSRQEAMGFLGELKDSYPGAYPVKDSNIHPREFLE